LLSCGAWDRHRIERPCGVAAERGVDAVGEPCRRGEIRRVQVELHILRTGEHVRHRALDHRAIGNAAGAGNVDRDPRPILGGDAEATDDDVALCDRIDLPVGAAQWRHQQRTAADRSGVADRGHGDVDLLAGLGEGRQFGIDRHRCDILQLRIDARRNRHAELREHRLQALHRERCLRGLVAAAVEANDEAITHQRIAAHTGDAGEVFHALGLRRHRRADQQGDQKEVRPLPLPRRRGQGRSPGRCTR